MTEKPAQDNLQLINFRATAEEIARLDQMAQECGHTRSQMIRNLLTVGMDEYALFKKVGIMRAAITLRDILEWMGAKAKTESENIDNGPSAKA